MPREMPSTVDKLEIAELLSRYCFAVDFRGFDDLYRVFAPDFKAVYRLASMGLEDVVLGSASEAIEWLRSSLGQGEPKPRHALVNHVVEVKGDRATSRSYLAGGNGLYEAEFRRDGDGWRMSALEMRTFSKTVPDLR